MELSNPRYPHWCKIVRKTFEDPMEDEDDSNPLDMDNYDPMGSDDDTSDNEDANQEETEGGSQTIVIYEGQCRSYKINTTSDKGVVITSQRGLALPLNQDEWDSLGLVPKEGDEIVVVHGETFKEYGRVVDKNVATASFAVTHLIWSYDRN